ncbi:MAG: glycosyltransferase family 2 protein [Bacteroidota bacterium]
MTGYSASPSLDVSIVIPLLNEEESLPELMEQIHTTLKDTYSYEVIFVNDGSTDRSWSVIKELDLKYDGVRGLCFRKNKGKSPALQAGFEAAEGRYVVTMDADLQDDPGEVPAMLKMLDDGMDLVSGWKKVRHDPITKTIPSRFFNFVTRKAAGIHLHDFNCGLKAYKKEVVKSIFLYGELHRYIPLLAKWEGFEKIGEKAVHHQARKYGVTKFGLNRFMNGFLDLITILFVHRYKHKPMHFFGTIGVFLLAVGGGINAYLAFIKLVYQVGIGGRPLLFLGILLMVLGVQFFTVGFLGELINSNHVKSQKPPINDILN